MNRAFVAAGLSVALLAGCGTVGYYAQSVGGHLAMVNAARPVAEVIADPATDPALKQRLALSQRMRDFAVQELGLPDNASYRRYADVGRPFAVWNVVAAPELSLTLQQWCFPVVGCVAYRGYYGEADYERLTAHMHDALQDHGVVLDAVLRCPHLRDAAIAEYRRLCDCRKPAPGMLLRAAAALGERSGSAPGSRPRISISPVSESGFWNTSPGACTVIDCICGRRLRCR